MGLESYLSNQIFKVLITSVGYGLRVGWDGVGMSGFGVVGRVE